MLSCLGVGESGGPLRLLSSERLEELLSNSPSRKIEQRGHNCAKFHPGIRTLRRGRREEEKKKKSAKVAIPPLLRLPKFEATISHEAGYSEGVRYFTPDKGHVVDRPDDEGVRKESRTQRLDQPGRESRTKRSARFDETSKHEAGLYDHMLKDGENAQVSIPDYAGIQYAIRLVYMYTQIQLSFIILFHVNVTRDYSRGM